MGFFLAPQTLDFLAGHSWLKKHFFLSDFWNWPTLGLSILIGILWGLTIIAGIFWGFYGNPYPDILAWCSSAGDLDLFLLIAICLAVGLSYLVIYRLGEIKGVTSMKNTALFRQFLDKRKKPGSDADTGREMNKVTS